MTTSRITICGGGNAAHTLAGLLGSYDGIRVRMYVPFGNEADLWNIGIQQNSGITVRVGNQIYKGCPEAICVDPRDAVSDSQIILLALPAFAHEVVLGEIAPYLQPGTWIGALPARGGFDLMARDILKDDLSRYTIFGFQTLPWACRIQIYGQQAMVLGKKEQVDLAVSPHHLSPVVTSEFQKLLGVKLNFVSNFLSLTLSDTGQIIHPGIMYGLFRGWDGAPYDSQLLFYQSVDVEIASILQSMSDEIQTLCLNIERQFSGIDLLSVHPIDKWILRSYSASITNKSSLQSCFATNSSYTGLLAPMQKIQNGYIPDYKSRYLLEDVPYNLLVTRGVAELSGVPTPLIDQVIEWAQIHLEKVYLLGGSLQGKDINDTRSPQRYGHKHLDRFIQDMQYLSLSHPSSISPSNA